MNEAKYMARLIDADKLNFHCNYNGDCSGDISHCKECDNYILGYRDIQEQPTAYDVDKVVEELKGAMWLTTNDDGETNKLSIQVVSFDDAIEIVKTGGKYF